MIPFGYRMHRCLAADWSVNYVVTAILTLTLLLTADSAALSMEKPTPLNWDQWEPEKEQSNSRLFSMVSIQTGEITIGELLDRLSKQTSINLTCMEELRKVRMTVFVKERPLSAVMVGMQDVLDGYWTIPRERSDTAPIYCLYSRDFEKASAYEWRAEVERDGWRAVNAPFREKRLERLAEYDAARELTPRELLDDIEPTDPWLCVSLLDPKLRPMIEAVCSLTPDEKIILVNQGCLAVPVQRFDKTIRRHLAQWSNGEHGEPSILNTAGGGVDVMPDLPSPEARWPSTVVWLWFRADQSLDLILEVPDVGGFGETIFYDREYDPAWARRKLIGMGWKDRTSDYADLIAREEQAWKIKQAETPSELEWSPGGVWGRPESKSLQLECTLDLMPGNNMLTLPSLLECAAEQCSIMVVASYLPDSTSENPRNWTGHLSEGSSLGDGLDAVHRALGGRLWWRFRGDMLVIRALEYRMIEEAAVDESVIQEWMALLRPGRTVTLDELASHAARLTSYQAIALGSAVNLQRARLSIIGLSIWGRLSDNQRLQLYAPEGLPISVLDSDIQGYLWNRAYLRRPWLTMADLSETVLRAIPRQLATGEEAVTIVVEYHLRDAPDARQVLFTLPLQRDLTEEAKTIPN